VVDRLDGDGGGDLSVAARLEKVALALDLVVLGEVSPCLSLGLVADTERLSAKQAAVATWFWGTLAAAAPCFTLECGAPAFTFYTYHYPHWRSLHLFSERSPENQIVLELGEVRHRC
jgi:hypothetical protein